MCIPCDNLSDRKALFMQQSDVHVILPGGIGSLDELFTVAASATIGYHSKPTILYNMKGFSDSLTALLDDPQQKGMIRGRWRNVIRVVNDFEDLNKELEAPL